MCAPRPGSNLARYFSERGHALSSDESLQLLQTLLRLSELGAISCAPADECRGSSPKTPASAGVSCADRGAGVGCARSARHALGEANAYNIASLIPSGESE